MPRRIYDIVKRWSHNEMDCLVAQSPVVGKSHGWYCGYVKLPDDARLPSECECVPPEIADLFPYEINFADAIFDVDGICDDVAIWYGFDMGHACDYGLPTEEWPLGVYLRTLDDAVHLTESLADVIASYVENVSDAHERCRFCDGDTVCVADLRGDPIRDGYAVTCYGCGARGPIAETIDRAWEAWDCQC